MYVIIYLSIAFTFFHLVYFRSNFESFKSGKRTVLLNEDLIKVCVLLQLDFLSLFPSFLTIVFVFVSA